MNVWQGRCTSLARTFQVHEAYRLLRIAPPFVHCIPLCLFTVVFVVPCIRGGARSLPVRYLNLLYIILQYSRTIGKVDGI